MDDQPFEDARPTLGWGLLLLPPAVAGASWMITSFCGGLVGIVLVHLVCVRLAWHVSRVIAEWRYAVQVQDAEEMLQEQPPEQSVGRLRLGLFVLELFAIAAASLAFLGAMGLVRAFVLVAG